MRIAVVVFRFPCLSETFALNQITGLIDRGHDVDVFALGGRPQHTIAVHPDVIEYRLLDRTIYAPRLPTNYGLRVLKAGGLFCLNLRRHPGVALRSLNVLAYGRRAASMSLLAATSAFAGRGNYDIILNQFGTVGLLTAVVRKWGVIGGKLVTFFRGSDISEYVRRRGHNVYTSLLEEGDLFLTNCQFFKQRILSLGCDPAKLFVHRSGIDCDRFSFRRPRRASDDLIRVATIGRLVEKKGIEYGIRAVARLLKAGWNIEYHIVGDGPLRNGLERLARQLRIGGAVVFHRGQGQRFIVKLLRQMDVFIAPCVTSANADQDAPVNSLKEAMAIGVPVIGTNHGGIPELVQDGITGLVVPQHDDESLAESIHWIINHPDTALKLTHAARKHVELFYDTKRLNDLLVERFQKLLDGNPGAVAVDQFRSACSSVQDSPW